MRAGWYVLPNRKVAHALLPIYGLEDATFGYVMCGRWPAGNHPALEWLDSPSAGRRHRRCKTCKRAVRALSKNNA